MLGFKHALIGKQYAHCFTANERTILSHFEFAMVKALRIFHSVLVASNIECFDNWLENFHLYAMIFCKIS